MTKYLGKFWNAKINNMSVARQKFEYNIIRGLHEKVANEIEFLSYVPTDGALTIPEYTYINEVKIKHFPVDKTSVLSMLMQMKKFNQWLLEHKDELKELKIIMYALNPLFLIPLLMARKKYGFKIITICSELPQLRRYGFSVPARIKRKIFTKLNNKFDGYVLFSKHMADRIKCNNIEKYIVLEGIAPDIQNRPQMNKKNIVMYAGGLAKDNNVAKLVDCCCKIKELDELWICGIGEDASYIEQVQKSDARIKYFGRVENRQVLKMERQAKVLVTIRSPKVELTKYSFPSKILEYIASGSLVVSTKLKGIPEEYFDYILETSEEEEEIISVLKQGLLMCEREYQVKCNMAQEYIKSKKNYLIQAEKIIELIKGI